MTLDGATAKHMPLINVLGGVRNELPVLFEIKDCTVAICMLFPGGIPCSPRGTNFQMAFFLATVDVSSKVNWV